MTTVDPIHTMYGDEFAAMLIEKRIPFTTTYEIENQTTFHISSEHIDHALEMMSMLRRTKLR